MNLSCYIGRKIALEYFCVEERLILFKYNIHLILNVLKAPLRQGAFSSFSFI